MFTASETFSEADEIVCCVIGIDFIDFAWSPRHLKKNWGCSIQEKAWGKEWMFTASENFFETDEIVCCHIGIDFIDFAWSLRDLFKKIGVFDPRKSLGERVVVHSLRNIF